MTELLTLLRARKQQILGLVIRLCIGVVETFYLIIVGIN